MGILKRGHSRHHSLIKRNLIFKVPYICSLECLFQASKCPWARHWTLNPCWSHCCLNVCEFCLVEQFEFEWSKMRWHLEGEVSNVLSSSSPSWTLKLLQKIQTMLIFTNQRGNTTAHSGTQVTFCILETCSQQKVLATIEKQGVDGKATVFVCSYTFLN